MALTKVSRGLLSTGIVDNSTATAITIDSGGSVLIGKATPTDLHNTWNHLIIGEKGAIISENGAGGIDGISISDNAYIDSDTGAYAYQTTAAASVVRQTAGIIQFANAASGSAGAALTFSETARIDASGNLLVGKTALEYDSTAGHIFRADGLQSSIRSGGNVADFNRLSDNGEIIRISKDGTTKGRIGTDGSDIYIGSDDTNLLFFSNGFLPANSVGGTRDNASDLGAGSARFKDLYLSGGAYLGGTAAANKLDLYETGTFTPVLKGSTATGSFTAGSSTTAKYVAIGDTVTISIALRDCTLSGASGEIYIDGCPFALAVGVNYPIGGFMSHNLSFDTAHHQSFYGQSDNIFGMQSRTGTSWSGFPVTNSSGIYLHITMVCTKV